MRAIWKGSISFGLVYIPIAVYPATKEEKLSFRQLRSSDLSPIKYKKVAEADSKEVSADQIVKGYEYERGRYVVLKEEDFAKVRIESTHSIDITDFSVAATVQKRRPRSGSFCCARSCPAIRSMRCSPPGARGRPTRPRRRRS